ncbi:MAG: hotdog domain-containing protein [Cyanobacteria bacterium P01_H01_bin.74]
MQPVIYDRLSFQECNLQNQTVEGDTLDTEQAETQRQFLRTPAYPWLIDSNGFMQVGHVLKLIDILGSEAALFYLNQGKAEKNIVVTASLDRTNFYETVHLWEMLHLNSKVTQVWRTSAEIEVSVCAENILTCKKRLVATAYLVFVALSSKSRERIEFPIYTPQTEADRQLGQAADLRKSNRIAETKELTIVPIEDNEDPYVMSRVMSFNDANAQSNVFGGIILSLMDDAGQAVAGKQALGQPIVGVRVDRMSFIAPTFLGETVVVKALPTKTWRSSMEVQVEVSAKNPNTNQVRQVATCYLVYVRLGPNRRPGEIPPWFPQTTLQERRAEQAQARREIREKEEKALRVH